MKSYFSTRSLLGPVVRLTFIALFVVAQTFSLMPLGIAQAVAPTSPPRLYRRHDHLHQQHSGNHRPEHFNRRLNHHGCWRRGLPMGR